MNDDDSWMRDLGRVAAEDEAAENRRFAVWERLAAGELSDEEAAALARQAEASPEARLTYEAFRPLGADFEARMADTLVAAANQPLSAPLGSSASAAPAVLPFPRRSKHIGWLAAAATIAATIGFQIASRLASPPLPLYAMEVAGGVRTTRGEAPAGTPIFPRGSVVTIVLRPPTAGAGKVAAICCFLEHGKTWRPWPLAAETANRSFRFAGRLDSDLAPGPWRLWAIVGRPGSLPDTPTMPSSLHPESPPHPGWQALTQDVIVE
jgi:hypothetical protein